MKKLILAAVAMLAVVSHAQAAQQCFRAGGPTTYGAVTATVTGCNDYNAAFVPFAANESQRFGTGVVCTYSFNKPLATSSLTIQLNSVGTGLQVTVSTNAGPYSPIPADIVSPLAGSGSTFALTSTGTNISALGNEGSGTVRLTNGAPATFTSISVAQTGAGSDSLVKVCADDASVLAAPVAATSIPTLSEWGLIIMAVIIGISGFLITRRRA